MSDDDIIVPFIPDSIITIFKNDYPYIQELLEYKRDGTLALLKAQGAIAFYNGSLGLDVKKDVKEWADFIEFSKNYTRKFVQEGLQKYQNKEKDSEKKQFQILDMGFLGPAVEMISNGINDSYLRRFPSWPSSPGTQEDFIEVNMKSSFESNQLRYYWICRGTIFVKDTKYEFPVKGCRYRAEFSGKPEFQIAYFDLDKIRQYNDMAQKSIAAVKKLIDKCEQKIIEQSLTKLLINMDIL